MNSLLMYIVKAIICSGILFLYYLLALRNKKFHQYNRFYLLFSVVFSLLIPFTHLSWFTVKENTANNFSIVKVLYQRDLEPIVITTEKINWVTIATYAFIVVSTILLLLLLIRVWNVFRLAKKYPKVKWDRVDFLDTDISNAPFSFLNLLFWKHDIDVQSEVGQQILEHELTHIRQKHTWDKLFMQIVSSIMWFNPFYWWMQKELLMIHEFLADEKAIKNHDGQSFAKMLLQSRFGSKARSLVHPFAYGPIQRRLKILTSSSNLKYSYMRKLFFLPLLTMVTGLFAFTVQKENLSETSTEVTNADIENPNNADVYSLQSKKETKISTRVDQYTHNVFGYDKNQKKKKQKVAESVEKEASYPGGVEAWKNFLVKNLRADVPISNRAPGGRNYTVIVTFIVGKDGNLSHIKADNNPGYGTAEEAVRVIRRGGKWNPAQQDGKPVVYRQRQQITFQVIDTKKESSKKG